MPNPYDGQPPALDLPAAHDQVVETFDQRPHPHRDDGHKLPAELTDAELLTGVLGPSTALSCEPAIAVGFSVESVGSQDIRLANSLSHSFSNSP
jgi:hypothetical protein